MLPIQLRISYQPIALLDHKVGYLGPMGVQKPDFCLPHCAEVHREVFEFDQLGVVEVKFEQFLLLVQVHYYHIPLDITQGKDLLILCCGNVGDLVIVVVNDILIVEVVPHHSEGLDGTVPGRRDQPLLFLEVEEVRHGVIVSSVWLGTGAEDDVEEVEVVVPTANGEEFIPFDWDNG